MSCLRRHSPIAADWLAQVSAPNRTLCWFENSGHLPMLEEPGRNLLALLSIHSYAERTDKVTASSPNYSKIGRS